MDHISDETGLSEPSHVSSLSQPAGNSSRASVSYEVLKGIVLAENDAPSFVLKEKKQISEESLKSLEAQESLLRLQAERDAFNTYHDLRKQWAMILKKLLYAMVGFEAALTFFVGFGWLHFPSQVFLNLIVGQTFLQIVGMCYIVVKFLFPNEKDPFQASKGTKTKKEKTSAHKAEAIDTEKE